MTRAFDLELNKCASLLKKYGGQVDQIARDRGVEGLLQLFADAEEVVRKGGWRCMDIIKEQGEKSGASQAPSTSAAVESSRP